MNKHDKENVSVICIDCHRQYNVKFGTYRKSKSKKDHIWVCKSCMNLRLYNSLSDEEKKSRKSKQFIGLQKWISNLSEEDKQKRSIHRSKLSKDRIANLSDEKFHEMMNAIWNGNKKYFDSISKSDKKIHIERMQQGRRQWWEGLTYIEQCDRLQKILSNRTNVGPSEHQLNTIFHWSGFIKDIQYQWGYNTEPYIHPDYFDLFGNVNSITGGMNCPYKNWDFILYGLDGQNILLDIDGSIHLVDYQSTYSNGIRYSNLDYVKYLESQRKYQIPNGMLGYVILCYDDELTDQTPIQSFQSDEIITFKELMAILKLHVLPPDDTCDKKNGY